LDKLSDPQFVTNTQFLFNLKYSGIKLGLEKIKHFLAEIGNPQSGKRFIHVAGTNGKGSTVAIMEAVLINHGYRTGAFTSPHLITYQERFRINQQLIPIEAINEFVKNYRHLIDHYKLTFFEASTALAFWYFSQFDLDYILLETGLGGRLDATNVVQAPVTAITRIGLDHTQYLGQTVEEIAREKAGIIHLLSHTYLADNPDKVKQIVISTCKETNSNFHYAPEIVRIHDYQLNPEQHVLTFTIQLSGTGEKMVLHSPLIGDFQLQNLQLALSVLLNEGIVPPDENQLNQSLQKIIWPGRLQLIEKHPAVYLDVGHNQDGFYAALQTIKEYYPERALTVITGIVDDKDANSIASALQKYGDRIILVDFESDRALKAEQYYRFFSEKEKVRISTDHVYETFMKEKSTISSEDILLIIGSHYLIGEFIIHDLKKKKKIDYFYKIP
jgi:dihydrofolate synthase/folylpolyglutamate synthase